MYQAVGVFNKIKQGAMLFVFHPNQVHSKNRALREEVYRANITKASSGDLDNSPIIQKILQLRKETAKLLGYDNYA